MISVSLDFLFQGFCPAQHGIAEYSENCVSCPECDLSVKRDTGMSHTEEGHLSRSRASGC